MTQVKISKEHIAVDTVRNHLFTKDKKGIYKNKFDT